MLSGLGSLHMKGALLGDLFAISENELALGGALFQGQQGPNVNTSNTESRKCGLLHGVRKGSLSHRSFSIKIIFKILSFSFDITHVLIII